MINYIDFKILFMKIIDVFNKIYGDSLEIFNKASVKNDTCNTIINMIVVLSLYGIVIYLVIYNFMLSNYYIYYRTTNLFRDNPILAIVPEYNQVTNIYYITDWFSIDWNLLMYIFYICLLYTSPSPRDRTRSRMPSSA